MIGYYQWVPLILVMQTVMFVIPRTVWVLLSKRSDVDLSSLMSATIKYQKTDKPEERQRFMTFIANHVGNYLVKQGSAGCRPADFTLSGVYLVVCYFIFKILYIANAVVQLILLDRFLAMDEYYFYGFHVLTKMATGQMWMTSERFPRVTLCDLKVRQLGNIHRYTIQCSLPLNLFHEIIFIFLWFWIALLLCFSLFSFSHWCLTGILPSRQASGIRTKLQTMNKARGNTQKALRDEDVHKFIDEFLKADGCLLVRFVSHNTSGIVAAEFTYDLWLYYSRTLDPAEEGDDDQLNQEVQPLVSSSNMNPWRSRDVGTRKFSHLSAHQPWSHAGFTGPNRQETLTLLWFDFRPAS